MPRIIDYVKNEYSFLIERNFAIEDVIERGNLYSQACLTGSSANLIFCFTLEKGKLSVAVTSKHILNSKKYGKYSKYCDCFYLIKLLDPNIDFSDITPVIYPDFIQNNLNDLITLFNAEHTETTLKRLNKIIKEYDQIRWNRQ